MPNVVDLANQKFGRLLVLRRAEPTNRSPKDRDAYWAVRCDCGNEKVLPGRRMRIGRVTSCGCLHPTHGLGRSSTYKTWAGMITRCTNPKSSSYPKYGGRGITVCPRWRENFANFLKDMGERPLSTSLDRIDNNGPYCLENCRWATRNEQARNTSRNRVLLVRGKPMVAVDAAKALGISKGVLYYRLKHNIALDAGTRSTRR